MSKMAVIYWSMTGNTQAMAEAIALIGGRAITEASGNVTAQNAAGYADLGVDVVSCGALTHSAGILDLSLKHLEVLG